MTTLVSITVEDCSSSRAEEAMGAALEEMERLAALLTRFDGGSPLAVLNADGRLADPPPELRAVLARGRDLHRLCAGAFDPTVAPLVDLYQVHFAAHGGPPDASERREVQELVGAAHLRLDDHGCRLERAGMALTLDGIAKGYIADRMVETLASRGVRHALVNAGGDIRALGSRAGGRPWRVGVQDPRRPGAIVERLALADAAVATSGDYVRFFDLERHCHHTVVPSTGASPDAIASVSVRAPTAMDADALATAVFVLGAEAGCRLVDELPGAACLLVMRDGTQSASGDWWTAGI
ncbi:MAG TPA: FAD:protein FMN transferase [Vicinamibacteria bacterium]|nr:FAD:protein FMN transferase [Vicinamibacteria bacterium]